MTEVNKGIIFLSDLTTDNPNYTEKITNIVNYFKTYSNSKPADIALSAIDETAPPRINGDFINSYEIPPTGEGIYTEGSKWRLVRIISSSFDGVTRVITDTTRNFTYSNGDTIPSADVPDQNSLLIMQHLTVGVIYKNLVYLPNLDYFEDIITSINGGVSLSEAIGQTQYNPATYYIGTYENSGPIILPDPNTTAADGGTLLFTYEKTWAVVRIVRVRKDIENNFYSTASPLNQPSINIETNGFSTFFLIPGPELDNNKGTLFYSRSFRIVDNYSNDGPANLFSILETNASLKALDIVLNFVENIPDTKVFFQDSTIIPSEFNFPNTGYWEITSFLGSTNTQGGAPHTKFNLSEPNQNPFLFAGNDISTIPRYNPNYIYLLEPATRLGFFFAESQEIVDSILEFLGTAKSLRDLWLNTEIPSSKYYWSAKRNIPANPGSAAAVPDLSGNPQLFSNTSWNIVAVKNIFDSTVYTIPSFLTLPKPSGYELSSNDYSTVYTLVRSVTEQVFDSLIFAIPSPTTTTTTTTTQPVNFTTEVNTGTIFVVDLFRTNPNYSEKISSIVDYFKANLSSKPSEIVTEAMFATPTLFNTGFVPYHAIPGSTNDEGIFAPGNKWNLVRIVSSTFDGSTRVVTDTIPSDISYTYSSSDVVRTVDAPDPNSLLIMQLSTVAVIYKNVIYLPNIDYVDNIVAKINSGFTVSLAVSTEYDPSMYYIGTYDYTFDGLSPPTLIIPNPTTKAADGITSIFAYEKTWNQLRAARFKRDVNGMAYSFVRSTNSNSAKKEIILPGYEILFLIPGRELDNNGSILFVSTSFLNGAWYPTNFVGTSNPVKVLTAFLEYYETIPDTKGVIQTSSTIPSGFNISNRGYWQPIGSFISYNTQGGPPHDIADVNVYSGTGPYFANGANITSLPGYNPNYLYIFVPAFRVGFFFAESQEIVDSISAFLGTSNGLADLWLNTTIPSSKYYWSARQDIPINPVSASAASVPDLSGNPQLFSNTSWNIVGLKNLFKSTVFTLPSFLTLPKQNGYKISNYDFSNSFEPIFNSSTDVTDLLIFAIPDPTATTTTVPPPCFLAGAMVHTDQGIKAIETIDAATHTIDGKRIVAITADKNPNARIVLLRKGLITEDIPDKDTLITVWHKVYYKDRFIIAGQVPGMRCRPYKGETLYNVLMETHETMIVNNLLCNTMPPEHAGADRYRK